jgi:hypothetical protein
VEYPGVPTGVPGELYDLTADPYQLQNRYADPAAQAQVQVWRQWLAAMRTCSGLLCQVLETYFVVPR